MLDRCRLRAVAAFSDVEAGGVQSVDVVWSMGAEAAELSLAFELSYGKPAAPAATWRTLPCSHREEGYGEMREYTTTLGGLAPGSTVAVRVRAASTPADGDDAGSLCVNQRPCWPILSQLTMSVSAVALRRRSDWSEKSDPIQVAGEKEALASKLASAAGEKLKEGAAAKIASAAARIPGGAAGGGLRGEAFMDAVRLPLPPPLVLRGAR